MALIEKGEFLRECPKEQHCIILNVVYSQLGVALHLPFHSPLPASLPPSQRLIKSQAELPRE
jgi:hypothetical protein